MTELKWWILIISLYCASLIFMVAGLWLLNKWEYAREEKIEGAKA